MKVATILPQRYLKLAKNDKYMMCLAHLLFEPGMDRYTKFFTHKPAGSFLIMDNGVIEGNPRPIEELTAKALSVGADEIILPDVYMDKDATLRVIDNAIGEADKFDFDLMAVPQGNTMEEWLECAQEIIGNYPNVKTIGIPKNLVSVAGRDARVFAIAELTKRSPMLRHKNIHLLGCWKTALELTVVDKAQRMGLIPMVRGVDSALPYVYARAGLLLNEDDRPDSESIDFKDGLMCADSAQEKARRKILKKNISLWRKAGDSRTWKEKFKDYVNK